MIPYAKLIIILLACYSTALSLSPEIAIGDFGQRLWTSEDGLPQNSIASMTQTRDGYLWLGTQAGLARFDGASFQVYSTKNSPLPHNDVFALVEDREGNLWIGTFGGGISRFRNGRFTNFGNKEGLTDEVVRCLFTDWRGVIWVGTRAGGIFSFQNGRFQQFSTRQGLANDNVRSILEDAQGNLWIGTENGLSRFREGNFKTFTTEDGLPNNSIRWIFKDSLENLWIATDGGLTVWRDGHFKNPLTDGKLSNESIRFVTEDQHRNIWIATDAGLNRIYNGKVTRYTNIERLSEDPILSIYEDREANLWIGTDGGGLIQLKELKFRNFGGTEGLPDHTSYSVLEDRSGNLWIGTRSGGLIRWKDGQKRIYTTEDGLVNNTVFALYEDSGGDLWIGTRGGGISLIRNNIVTGTKVEQLSNPTVRAILQTRDGSYWIGTNSGLNRWKDGNNRIFTPQDGLANGFIYSLVEGHDGTLWIGTFRGLSRWKDGKLTTISHPEKLRTASIWSMQEDSKGDLWIATYGSGLFHLHGEKITNFTSQDGLYEDTILTIQEDEDENLWMSTYHGIFKVTKKDLMHFELGGLKRIQFTVYDAADGMKNGEGVGGVQPSSWKTHEGRLLFLTVKGITELDPRNVRTNPLPPPVRLEQIMYDGVMNAAYKVGNNVSFPPGKGNFEFHYSALSFVAPEKVRFRYQLHGFDQNFIDASTRRIAYYTKVPPGNYRFQVIACNNDGRWNESGVLFSFRVRPHFYQTYWFYGGLILLALSAIYGFHRLRVRRLRTQFSAVLEERNRISREIHDTLTQNFTAVVLQLETAELALEEEPETTRDALQKARGLARDGLAESRRFVRALRPAPLEQSDLIAALSVVTAQALGGSGIEYEMHVKGKKRVLPQNVEDNLLRITQEAIANVVKHAQARHVEIEMIYKVLGIELHIRDDGRGIDAIHSGRYEGGFGLISMRERAEQIRGQVEFKSTPNGGTEIIVKI